MGSASWTPGAIMSEASELWVNLLPKNSDEQKPASRRHDYCKQVLALLEARHPNLYFGQTGATLSLGEAQALVDALQKNTPGHIFKHRISYLIRGLEKGALELGWDVAIPQPPLVITRDKPRFTIESFTALPIVSAVASAFLEDLKQSPPETYTTRVGQLLLSAILFGGLVQKRWLTPWVEVLPLVICTTSQLWLNIVLTPVHLDRERRATGKTGKTKPTHSDSREKWEIHKRWFADPLSQSLILRWCKEFPEDSNASHNASPIMAIRQYLDLILRNKRKTSESFVLALLQGSATRTGLGIPPFLLAYAEGINKSVSLPSEAWERLLTGKCITTSRKNLKKNDDEHIPVADHLDIPEARHIAPMVHQEKMLKEVLRHILPTATTCKRTSKDSREALQIYYEKNQVTMCQSLSCLVQWCIDLLTHYNQQELIRGRVKSSIRASSVRRYLDAIGKRLITVANNVEILTLESDELHDVYQEVIDICPTKKSKNTAGTRLYGFHQFLSSKLGAPSVDFSDLGVKSGPAETGVNANLISFDSYDQMQMSLCPIYPKASRMRKMQFLLAIIAFRCGLRRKEALKLRLIDFQGDAEPELLVRSNRYAYVKSSESTRRLPLEFLLEADELMYLLAWRQDRRLEDVTSIPESLLFCQAGQPTVLLPEHEVFPPIMQALHQVTGDANLVFHHFRHSFATWLLIRLLKNFLPEIRQRFHFLRHNQFNPSNCDRLRRAILGNQLLGRQALFATAQLCGHAGPEVTLLHYIHLCDWLLGVELAALDNQPNLDVATIVKITGIKQHILYYDMGNQNDAPWQMSLVLDRVAIPEKFKPQNIVQKVDTRHIPEKAPDHPDLIIPLWRRVIAIIKDRQMAGLPFDTLAARSGCSEDDVKSWCNNVELLIAMKTKRGYPRHLNGSTSRANPDFQFPKLLRDNESRKIAECILATFEKSRGRKKQGIIQGVRDFIASFSVGEGGVSCPTHQKIKKQIHFLTSLNIPPQQIHVVRVEPKTAKLSPLKVQKNLALRFGLPESSVTVRGLYVHEYSRAGYNLVQVKNAHTNTNGIFKGNYGFRFAMYMIAIMAGLE
jgi:integrase